MDAAPPDDDCAHLRVDLWELPPEVMLLLDQSGSMANDMEGTDLPRWECMRDALVDPETGVVAHLAPYMSLGATLYTGYPTEGECPSLTGVDPAPDNFNAIRALLDDNLPAEETPTGQALDAVVAAWTGRPDGGPARGIVVLATDGMPDTCAETSDRSGKSAALNAVQGAFALGLRVFVLAIAVKATNPDLEHLQQLANEGVGLDAEGPEAAPLYVASAADQILPGFERALGNARSCVLALEGSFDPAEANQGLVRLQGVELGYRDPDGWRVIDEHTIRLEGAACTSFLAASDGVLLVDFPCELF